MPGERLGPRPRARVRGDSETAGGAVGLQWLQPAHDQPACDLLCRLQTAATGDQARESPGRDLCRPQRLHSSQGQ